MSSLLRSSRLILMAVFFVVVPRAFAQAPVITAISAPRQVVTKDQSLTLSVTAPAATSYQWKRNGRPIATATAASYTINSAAPIVDNGWYQAVATNGSGSTTSATVFVNVALNPAHVYAWGNNFSGQILVPSGLTNITAVAGGNSHSLALRSDGTVVAWGHNVSGQSDVPAGLNNVVAISAYSGTSVALRADGTVVAWGMTQGAPAGVAGIVAIAASGNGVLCLKADGTVLRFYTGSIATDTPAGLSNVVSIGTGNFHFLAVTADGALVAWGHNSSGQTNVPATLSGVVAATGGSGHSLALKSDGTVVGWGSIGAVPAGIANIVAIGAGLSAGFGLKADGTLVAWGSGSSGQVSIPAGMSKVAGFSSGDYHVLALRDPATDVVPTITTQPPSSVSVSQSGTVSFSMVASGNGPLFYQWRKAGSPIFASINLPTLTLGNAQTADAGNYDVVVSSPGGSVISTPVSVTVVLPSAPSFTKQPASGNINVGNIGSFSVTAAGTAPFTYQWRKGGVPIPGATRADGVYIIGPVQLADVGTYDVVVSNAHGSAISDVATLVVNALAAPAFTLQPVSGILNVGDVASFRAGVTGAVPLTLQWRKNGVPISGANGPLLIVGEAQLGDAGAYDLVVSNPLGIATSDAATLLFTSLLVAPAITLQPSGQDVVIGANAHFSVAATGSPTPTFQWRRNGTSIAGATASTFQITLVQDSDAALYDVVVTNAKATVVSGAAALTVRGRPVLWSAQLALTAGDVIGAFTVEGTAPKRLLARAVGPTLASYGISNPLADPKIEIFDRSGQVIASNDDWSTHGDQAGLFAASAAAGALPLGHGSKDAVVLLSYSPGTYTARVTAASPGGRIVQLELYDAEPASTTRVPYAAVRGRAAPGSDIIISGLAARGTSQRVFLLRASGPALGRSGTLANPTFTLLRGVEVRASNDDWQSGPDTAGVAAAAGRVGTFPFADGSRDSALFVAGSVRETETNTAQISGAGGSGGLVLVEAIEADEARPIAHAPAVVSPPISQTILTGTNVTLEARAIGTEPLSYQWRKNGADLIGANARALALVNVAPAHAGSYRVVVTNGHGTATSAPAVLVADTTGTAATAAHMLTSSGYTAGATLTVTNTLTYSGAATSVAWSAVVPAGWSYASGTGEGDVKPAVGATGTLEWSWSTPSASPVTFTYTLNVPAAESGVRSLSALALVRATESVQSVTASPGPLLLFPNSPFHSADTDQDRALNLFELTRVIELYNTRSGTQRTGAYRPEAANLEDGFAGEPSRPPGAAATLMRYHSADTRGAAAGTPPDGAIDLFELTRVIELYNIRAGTVRTGRYHVQVGTEDGFAGGP